MGKDGLEKKRSSDWKYMEDQQTQYSPEPRVQVANSSSIPTSNLTKTAGRRRKASMDGNPQPSKRSRVAPIYTMWRCVSGTLAMEDEKSNDFGSIFV
jgi:hypothetical protein